MLRFVLFDAVGTLIHSRVPVAEVYRRAGCDAGIELDVSTISDRFRAAIREHADSALPTSESRERERWRRIVASVFRELDATEAIFQRLWNEFGSADAWSLYPDVADTIRQLSSENIRFGIASNFDQRLPAVLEACGLAISANRLFHSGMLGWSKPNPNFYREIESRLNVASNELLLVGDDCQNDYLAPRKFGWHSIWLRRTNSTTETDVDTVTSLAEIPERVKQLAQFEQR